MKRQDVIEVMARAIRWSNSISYEEKAEAALDAFLDRLPEIEKSYLVADVPNGVPYITHDNFPAKEVKDERAIEYYQQILKMRKKNEGSN